VLTRCPCNENVRLGSPQPSHEHRPDGPCGRIFDATNICNSKLRGVWHPSGSGALDYMPLFLLASVNGWCSWCSCLSIYEATAPPPPPTDNGGLLMSKVDPLLLEFQQEAWDS